MAFPSATRITVRPSAFTPPAKQPDASAHSGIQENIECIKETTSRRRANNRDNLTQAMRAGRLLLDIKSQVKRGEWVNWLKDHVDELGYGLVSTSPVRAAQYDMALWKRMSAYQDRLVELKLLGSSEPDEDGVVRNMEDDNITVAISAFYELTRRDASETAIEIALDGIAAGTYSEGQLDTNGAKKLVRYSNAVDSLPAEHRETAKKLYHKGLDSPDIAKRIPQLAEEHPEILEEMVASGSLSVPHRETQMTLDDISETDLDLAVGETEVEQAWEYINRNKPLTADVKTAKKRNLKQGGVFEGTLDQVLHQLEELRKKDDGRFMRVSLWYEEFIDSDSE